MFERRTATEARGLAQGTWMKVTKTGRIGVEEERRAEWVTLRFPEGRRLTFHLRELELVPDQVAC